MLRQAYLDLSRFLATIRLGHTDANFFNPSDPVQGALFHQEDRLPFSFRCQSSSGDAFLTSL